MAKKKDETMEQYAKRREKEMAKSRNEKIYSGAFGNKDPFSSMFNKKLKGNQYSKLRGI